MSETDDSPPSPDGENPARRNTARWAVLGLGALLGVLAVRLVSLQVLRHGELGGKAERQQERQRDVAPRRGEIVDRHGKALAVTLSVPSIYAEPRRLAKECPKARPEIARRLAKILGLDVRATHAKLCEDRAFVWIKRQALDAQWNRLKGMKMPGVGMTPEAKRFYPHGASAGPLLGLTGIDGQPLAGQELTYQSVLRGTAGHEECTRDAKGRSIVREAEDPLHGSSLVTTLDAGIQEVAEQALDHLLEHCTCKSAVAIVLDPPTGEILAMASRPGFDPNRPGRTNPALLQNPATLLCYEPGSTFKPFIVGPALAEGKVRADEKFFCHNGSWRVPGRKKPLHDYHPHGWLTVTDVLAQSSNIGAAQIGQRLGMPKIHDYLQRFGFGRKTGVDLPGEQAGILNPPAKWTGATIYSVPMGHEIAVTPIQLLAAFNVFANRGVWVQPHLLRSVRDPDGRILKSWEGAPPRRVLPEAVVQGPLLEALRAVVERGTAKGSQAKGIPSAGKTGTAQKIGKGGQYLHDAWVSSYVCFAPLDRPRMTILVVVDEPHNSKGGYTGGAVAAPVAKEILECALHLRDREAVLPPMAVPKS